MNYLPIFFSFRQRLFYAMLCRSRYQMFYYQVFILRTLLTTTKYRPKKFSSYSLGSRRSDYIKSVSRRYSFLFSLHSNNVPMIIDSYILLPRKIRITFLLIIFKKYVSFILKLQYYNSQLTVVIWKYFDKFQKELCRTHSCENSRNIFWCLYWDASNIWIRCDLCTHKGTR